MKTRLLCILCAVCMLAACSPRSASPSSSEKTPPSSSEESSALPVIETKELPPEPESSSKEEEPEEELYPAPLLTDTEKEMLAGNLALFVHFIGASDIASPNDVAAETILAASLAEIERTKDMNALFFEQDDAGNDLVPAELVTDKAMQLFGVEGFDGTAAESYNGDKKCYVTQAVEITPADASEIRGAPDDNVAYSVKIDGEEYLFTGKILRQNGMPYLRFVSSEKTNPAK